MWSIAKGEVNDSTAYKKMIYSGNANSLKVGQEIDITNIYNSNYPNPFGNISYNSADSRNYDTSNDGAYVEYWEQVAVLTVAGVAFIKMSGSILGRVSGKLSTATISIDAKIANQMPRRGWSYSSINDIVKKPYTTRAATNKATNNSATAFYNEAGDYVVKDDITDGIIQISKFGDKDWIPDSTIINPFKP